MSGPRWVRIAVVVAALALVGWSFTDASPDRPTTAGAHVSARAAADAPTPAPSPVRPLLLVALGGLVALAVGPVQWRRDPGRQAPRARSGSHRWRARLVGAPPLTA